MEVNEIDQADIEKQLAADPENVEVGADSKLESAKPIPGEHVEVVSLLQLSLARLKELDGQLPCRENSMSMKCLVEAVQWQERRTQDRKARGVEGTDKP